MQENDNEKLVLNLRAKTNLEGLAWGRDEEQMEFSAFLLSKFLNAGKEGGKSFAELGHETLEENSGYLFNMMTSLIATGRSFAKFGEEIVKILDQKDQKIKELEEKLNAK